MNSERAVCVIGEACKKYRIMYNSVLRNKQYKQSFDDQVRSMEAGWKPAQVYPYCNMDKGKDIPRRNLEGFA